MRPAQASVADSLIEDLQGRIRSTGPMPFVDFMQLALYHPRGGYYATRVPGHGADYRTSPSISPWFGRLVARELQGMWESLGWPEPFWVVEVGAGLGDLAAEAMGSAEPVARALRWRFIERFERVRDWQRRRLGGAVGAAEWASVLGEPPGVVGCVLANEILDAFPVHVLEVVGDGAARELYVDVDGSRFVERLGPLSVSALDEPVRRAAVHLEEGARFEVCLELEGWFDQASRALRRGYLLVIDYGNVEPDLWLESRAGSLASPGPADLGSSPLEQPGRKDITARVNFSAVTRTAQRAGFCLQPLITQRAWLRTLGLESIADEIDLARIHASLGGWIEETVALEEELANLLELTARGELGDLLVLRGAKGVAA